MQVKVNYDNGDSRVITNDFLTISPARLDTASLGEDIQVTVSYTERGVTVSNTFCIDIIEKYVLDGITINTMPLNQKYLDGAKFNPKGMVIDASYSNGSTKLITIDSSEDARITSNPETFSFENSDLINVEVSYTENSITKTAVELVTVKEYKEIIGLKIATGNEFKSEYYRGEYFNDDGLSVRVCYSDG